MLRGRTRKERRQEKRGGGEGSAVEKEERWGGGGVGKQKAASRGGERLCFRASSARPGREGSQPPASHPDLSTITYELSPREAALAATISRRREFLYLNPNSASTRRKRHKSPYYAGCPMLLSVWAINCRTSLPTITRTNFSLSPSFLPAFHSLAIQLGSCFFSIASFITRTRCTPRFSAQKSNDIRSRSYIFHFFVISPIT